MAVPSHSQIAESARHWIVLTMRLWARRLLIPGWLGGAAAQRNERSGQALTAGQTAAVRAYDKFLATPRGRP
jgi:hypothetical protein